MSLHNLANHVQSLGRGKDSQLVHMTPREVGGLQTLARAHGGSLSINPNTGLPEAGFLSDILPTIAGSVVGAYAGPWAGAAVGGGLGYAMNGGNLQKGLMSGIGAYGGSQIGSNFMGAGASSVASELAPKAAEAASQALNNPAAGSFVQGVITPEQLSAGVSSGLYTPEQAQIYGDAYSKVFAGAPSFLTTGLSDSSAWAKNAMPLGMLALGAIGAANSGTTGINAPAGTPTPGYIRPSTYSQTKNPNFGQPGQPYFNQSYTAQTPILASNYNTTAMYPQPTTAAGGGLMSLAGGGMAMDQNPMYPGSQQIPSQYATPSQAPISSSTLNASYEPKTNAYTGEMNLASGGIAALRFDDGGDVQQAPQAEPTWKPTDPVKLQSMDQMLAGDTSGKEFKPTENGYKWNADYGRFMNPNGSTILVNPDGSVVNATPAYKDYEFNGQYFNPAGENVSWNPEKNQSAYKLGGVEVPIGRENMKGIAAYTDQAGKPQMQIDQAGQPMFTEPEGLRYTGNFMDDTGAPMIAGALLGGTAALAGGAFGSAGTTMAGEAAASGAAGAGNAPVYSFDAPFTASNAIPSAIPSAVPSAVANAVPPAGSLMPNSNYMLGTYLASQALGGMGGGGGGGGNVGGGIGNPYPTTSALQIPQYNSATHQYVNAAQGGIMGHYASGGIANLGGYSDGGRLLKGPGDGVSDSIPAQIGNNQPARLADGEFVVPARIVSELGNGSTEAGAKQLYKMMDRIQAKRRKTKNMATDTKSYKALPA